MPVQCSGCGAYVDEAAYTCPSCGRLNDGYRPVKERERRPVMGMVGGLVNIVMAILLFVGGLIFVLNEYDAYLGLLHFAFAAAVIVTTILALVKRSWQLCLASSALVVAPGLIDLALTGGAVPVGWILVGVGAVALVLMYLARGELTAASEWVETPPPR